jgi:hypothetical protein
LQGDLPCCLRRRPQPLAIDLHLVPYHGEPLRDPDEVYRSKAKSGTSHFHAYATAYVIHREAEDRSGVSEAEYGRQCDFLRDIFGHPFRPIAVDPGWLMPGVVELARTIYEGRAFDRMPELADTPERAGGGNPDMLAHCRQPGEHVRGCWVVDAILGKT